MMRTKLRRVDRARFQELTFPHLAFLYNVALKYTGRKYDAEDLVQEAMYIAFRKFYQLRDEERCRSWLFSILRTTFLKQRRSVRRWTMFDDGSGYLELLADQSVESLEESFDKKIDGRLVQDSLAGLTEKHRLPLILYYMEEMTYQEIADYLNIPIGTVMSRLARAKKQLKKGLLKAIEIRSVSSRVSWLTTLLHLGRGHEL